MQTLTLGQEGWTDPPVPSTWSGPKINRHTPNPPTEMSERKAQAAYRLLEASFDRMLESDGKYQLDPLIYYQAAYDVSRSPKWAVSYTHKTGRDWEPGAEKKKRKGYGFTLADVPGHELTEKRIGRDLESALRYANFVLRPGRFNSGIYSRRRFLPGEAVIIGAGPKPLLQYIKYLSRVNLHPGVKLFAWPEVEPVLAKDLDIWAEYKEGIGNKDLKVPSAPYIPPTTPTKKGTILGIPWWIWAGAAVGAYFLWSRGDGNNTEDYVD